MDLEKKGGRWRREEGKGGETGREVGWIKKRGREERRGRERGRDKRRGNGERGSGDERVQGTLMDGFSGSDFLSHSTGSES